MTARPEIVIFQGTRVRIDGAAADITANDFDALLIPGGYSPDQLRADEEVVRFTRGFALSGKTGGLPKWNYPTFMRIVRKNEPESFPGKGKCRLLAVRNGVPSPGRFRQRLSGSEKTCMDNSQQIRHRPSKP